MPARSVPPRLWAVLAAALVALVALAGCSDAGVASRDPAAVPLPPSTGGVVGYVVDGDSQRLEGATVILFPEGLVAQSGAEGEFVFRSLEPGNHSIQAGKEGYEAKVADFEVPEGGYIEVVIFAYAKSNT